MLPRKLRMFAGLDQEGYNSSTDSSPYGCQITQNGSSGSYTYDFSGRPSGAEADWVDRPVNYVSWGDAARFAEAETALLEAHRILETAIGAARSRTATVIWLLADLYDTWHEAEPGKGYDAEAAEWRAKLPAPERTGSLILLGMRLLKDGRHAEAETPPGECLAIRQGALPEGHGLIFNAMSVLGESLAGQGADRSLTVAARIEKLREAEPLLLEGCERMKDHPEATDERKREALERIVQLYDTWHEAEPDQGYDAKATQWRAKLPPPSRPLQQNKDDIRPATVPLENSPVNPVRMSTSSSETPTWPWFAHGRTSYSSVRFC